ncbi:MAG: ergothioneine biosynthesis protein EgtB [Flavobacteriaceae bacterium]|uniref:ergothioneine biosynthesis protein EgtB n=1 Tax=Flavobacterium sp. Leaf359 TaxID=1736351 RepID=UPI0006F92178|nr:ergothioneine biosynthesis protein EgtB [Flavobacterium sp. Leaf359]KQS52647.1 sulfatase maturase [Flavobacterium sp. Leaf359]PZO32551.1 MAG: ergothioneine biosynthesis protein EgtB [Flavobacteriaceae bacterium]PZQ87913.1 MAG: ergothioneine biosynthesis protein EgtB [Flavobacterium johnsoniae]
MTLSDRYNSIRKHTEHLCNALTTEDFVPQPADFVSPPKWHLAHTTWFFEQFVLNEHLPDYKLFDDDFSFLFNSYYNFVGKRVFRADRGNITRPGVHEVFEYRSYVDMHMQILLQLKSEELKDLIELGLNHEQQHQELLITDIKYILGNNPIFPVYDENIDWEKQENEETGFVKLEEGIYEIGFEGEGFSFDNEHGRHKVYLHDFEISKSLVTNAEYLEFISNGGYKNFDYWLDEGWSWVTENKIEAPLYWHKIDGEWHNYTLGGLEKLNPEAILTHISFYEAVAFAAWKKMRLPTEFEWEAAADKFNWGKRWEWTNSAYLPYPNFKKPEGAIGEYNGKFMVNQMVLRGASCATPPQHDRKTYRNFFHAHERWQFNGIRLAK